jgi:hypothetical protein
VPGAVEVVVETTRVEVFVPLNGRITLGGLSVVIGPPDAVRETLPEKVGPPVKVIIPVWLAPPACWDQELGLEEMEKA